MISLAARAEMSFGGSSAPACYAELKNVGTLSPDQAENLSKILCQELFNWVLACPKNASTSSSPTPTALCGVEWRYLWLDERVRTPANQCLPSSDATGRAGRHGGASAACAVLRTS